MPVESAGPIIPDGTESVLTLLGQKYGKGRTLTLCERLMAMSATAATTADRYGPGPEDMVVTPPDLPEDVKGVLANYVS